MKLQHLICILQIPLTSHVFAQLQPSGPLGGSGRSDRRQPFGSRTSPAQPSYPGTPSTNQQSDWFEKHLYAPSKLEPTRRYFSTFPKELSSLPSRQLTAEERKQNARTYLMLSLATGFASHQYQPTNETEKWAKALLKFGSDWGISQSLEVLFPDSSSTERAAIEGALGAITELKITPNQITAAMTKSVLSDQLKQRDPNLALGVDIAERIFDLVNDSIKGTGG